MLSLQINSLLSNSPTGCDLAVFKLKMKRMKTSTKLSISNKFFKVSTSSTFLLNDSKALLVLGNPMLTQLNNISVDHSFLNYFFEAAIFLN